jgi:hypothetical protein
MVSITLNLRRTSRTIMRSMRSTGLSIHDVMGRENGFNFSYIGKGIVRHMIVGKMPPTSSRPKKWKSTIDEKGLLYEQWNIKARKMNS